MTHFGKKPNATASAAAHATSAAPEAELEQAEAPKQEAPAQAPKTKTLIRAVHGMMIHPYKPMDIRKDAITEVDEIDSWLQSQIDAGKIQVV